MTNKQCFESIIRIEMVPKCLKKGPRLGMAILDTRNSLDLQGGSGKIKMRLFFLKKGDFILMLFITTLSIIDEEDVYTH